jgi:1-acyl-sn-glycerol-3-phosphate acyltransferase
MGLRELGDARLVGRLMRRIASWLALQSLLLLLALVSIGWNLIALVLLPLLPRAAGRRVGRAAIARGYRWYWGVVERCGMMSLRAEALDALRDEPRLIVAANHPSMLDAPMIVARLPASFCVMKASLLRNPLLGPGARLARYIRNDTPLGVVRNAVNHLREGGQLVWFPEGTRTTRQPLNAFRPGVTLIAKMAGAPIQAVFIDTDSPYLGKGWPPWRLPPLPIRFSVRLGRRFDPAADPARLLEDLESYFAAGVRNG